MPLTNSQAKVLGWMSDPVSYMPVGCIVFAGKDRNPEMVGVTITNDSFQIHLLAIGRYAGGGKWVNMEPNQARDLARQLNSLADKADEYRKDEKDKSVAWDTGVR